MMPPETCPPVSDLSPVLREQLENCLRDDNEQRCIAPTFYVDEAMRELEAKAVFNEWVCVGRSENVANAGDFGKGIGCK